MDIQKQLSNSLQSNMGLQVITGYCVLKEGEVVLDLGSGGLDCFLARKQVGESGLYGVDKD